MISEQERADGYRDGWDLSSPVPSDNRSASYRHGFAVARADRAGEAAFGCAAEARRQAQLAAERDEAA